MSDTHVGPPTATSTPIRGSTSSTGSKTQSLFRSVVEGGIRKPTTDDIAGNGWGLGLDLVP